MKFSQPNLSETMRDNVQAKILALIRKKGLRRGDKLPTYRALCRQLETSIVTVQRAMHDLARDGQVRLIHGKGAFVATNEAAGNRKLTRIGVVYRGSRHGMLIQPYLVQILMGLLDYADRWQADLNIFSVRATKGRLTPRQVSEAVDGVILLGEQREGDVAQYLDENVPTVVVDHITESVALDFVTCENAQAAEAVVEHLWKLGHRQVAYVAHAPMDWDGQERFDAFRDGAARRGMQVLTADPAALPGLFQELKAKKASAPTALIAKDTQGARSLVRELEARQIAVPAQVSVAAIIGAEGDEHAGHHQLTRCNVRFLEMGHAAALRLLARCQSRNPAQRQIHRIPAELIKGTTTAAPLAH